MVLKTNKALNVQSSRNNNERVFAPTEYSLTFIEPSAGEEDQSLQ